jgi:predicted ATP-dependent serine protease
MKKIGNFFECEECHLLYDEEHWVKKCEQWCIEYKSCNLEITRHATKQSKLSLSKLS